MFFRELVVYYRYYVFYCKSRVSFLAIPGFGAVGLIYPEDLLHAAGVAQIQAHELAQILQRRFGVYQNAQLVFWGIRQNVSLLVVFPQSARGGLVDVPKQEILHGEGCPGPLQCLAEAAAAKRGIPIYEYTPLQIKQAITGYGRADKKQMQLMVKNILNLNAIPKPDDAADALAVAICHGNSNVMNEELGTNRL